MGDPTKALADAVSGREEWLMPPAACRKDTLQEGREMLLWSPAALEREEISSLDSQRHEMILKGS